MFFAKTPAQVPIGFFQAKNREFFQDVNETADDRYAQSGDRAEGRAFDTHAADVDEKQIQQDVYYGRENQEIKRRTAVSQSADDTGKQVVKHNHYQAVGDDGDESKRFIEYFFRNVHQAQYRTEKQKQRQAENGRKRRADDGCRRDGAAHGRKVAGTEFLCRDDGQAAGEADSDRNEQEKQRSRCADRSEGIYAEQTSDDNDVGYAV